MAKSVLLIFFLGLLFTFGAAADPGPLQDFGVAQAGTAVHLPGNTSNAVSSRVTPALAFLLPGRNTLGISMARIDYAPWGFNPPHAYLLATKILIVLEGTVNQNPGVITVANAVFGSIPDIAMDILAKAFQVDKTIVGQIQSKF
ncbi:hypothetical protein EUGRSUZ_D01603 [Eucalyptus grandis]|uniref:Uncharacterized protein n=2 Tax=Eucalyptus grandis TaxID=71139 RepID=A0ACC3KW65_EUCGR|nr:hypothetical protein EUGRSUZ_D01603 [Eucalyptus grandis]